MTRWIFEPGHTAAGFRARHMMVTEVRGHFKNVRGWLEFDPADPGRGAAEAVIEAAGLWTGEPDRDAHLKSADFLDVENHAEIRFRGDRVRAAGSHDLRVAGELTIRGTTRPVELEARYLGTWETPYWDGDVDRGPVPRVGFFARTRIDRHDFGVSWNAPLARGGIVVGRDVWITIDVQALEAGVIPGVE